MAAAARAPADPREKYVEADAVGFAAEGAPAEPATGADAHRIRSALDIPPLDMSTTHFAVT